MEKENVCLLACKIKIILFIEVLIRKNHKELEVFTCENEENIFQSYTVQKNVKNNGQN